MKTAILSILAGLMVVGSAVALPTPEEVKGMCDERPDLYVWVENTQACIPINPCKSKTAEIKKAYCLEDMFHILPGDSNKRDMIINKYVNKVLGTTVTSISQINDTDYFGVKTEKGGYFVASYKNENYSKLVLAVRNTFAAYGQEKLGFYRPMELLERTDIECYTKYNVPNEAECIEMRDFASSLAGETIEYFYYENNCFLFFPKQNAM